MLWFIVIALSVLLIYLKLIKPLFYWKEKGVPYLTPVPLFGNMLTTAFRLETALEQNLNLYNSVGDNRYMGIFIFSKPAMVIKDLDLIKQIYVKDFDHFIDRNTLVTEDIEPVFGRILLFLTGKKWKHMRSILSPAFTSSKMRTMFNLMSESSEKLTDYFEKSVDGNKPIIVEMKDVTTRFATDVIANCAFGIQTNSLEEKENEFYTMAQRTSFNASGRAIKFIGLLISQKLMKFLNIKLFSEEENNYYRNLVNKTMEIRERENIYRPDMIHLLMEAKKGQLKHESTTDEDAGFATVEESQVGKMDNQTELVQDDLVAQAVLFFAAGFDTTSTVLSFMSYELAVHEEIQRKLQEEIDEIMKDCNGKITYEKILKMKYLDMVVCETLRLWPPIPAIDRFCVKPFVVKPVKPDEKEFVIEKNITLAITIFGLHTDPKYWEEPKKFDPERFNEENKRKIIPFTYVPFGIGPRNCIGSRFALLEVKAYFVHLLSKFDIVAVEKTQIPIKLDKGLVGLNSEKGFWLGLKLRNK